MLSSILVLVLSHPHSDSPPPSAGPRYEPPRALTLSGQLMGGVAGNPFGASFAGGGTLVGGLRTGIFEAGLEGGAVAFPGSIGSRCIDGCFEGANGTLVGVELGLRARPKRKIHLPIRVRSGLLFAERLNLYAGVSVAVAFMKPERRWSWEIIAADIRSYFDTNALVSIQVGARLTWDMVEF